MKITEKQKKVLEAKYKQALKNDKEGLSQYYTVDIYLRDCETLLNNISNYRKNRIYCAIKPSPSGMSRRIAFRENYNMVLNITNHNKFSYNAVNVSGCGMDMLWYTLYSFCETAKGYKQANKHLNSDCSHCTYVLSFERD